MQELIKVNKENAMQVFTTPDGLDQTIQMIKEQVDLHASDTTTSSGRKAIASLAAKVSKCKVFLDGVGKDLVSEWKAKAKLVDNSRKSMRETLDDLRDEARKPLTDFEEKEREENIAKQARIEAETKAAKFKQDKIDACAKAKKLELQIKQDKIGSEKREIAAAENAKQAEIQRQEEIRRIEEAERKQIKENKKKMLQELKENEAIVDKIKLEISQHIYFKFHLWEITEPQMEIIIQAIFSCPRLEVIYEA